MDFRIIKLNVGGYIPEVLKVDGWYGIYMESRDLKDIVLGVRNYKSWPTSMEYKIDNCVVKTEVKAEKIINDYYDWLIIKEQKERFVVVKEITKE